MTMQASSVLEPKRREVFIKSTKIPATNKDAFDYHAREGALERLVPPWSILTVTSHEGNIQEGAISTLKVRLWPISFKWTAAHFGYLQDLRFQDKMVKGPFQSWIHPIHSYPTK